MNKFSTFCIIVLYFVNIQAFAVDLGVAKDYNIFVKGDFNHTGYSDSQGKIAVGGNANVDALDVAVNYEPNSHREGVQFQQSNSGVSDVLVVQGDLTVNEYRVDNIKGNLVLGGSFFKGNTEIINPNDLAQGQNPVINVGEIKAYDTNPINFNAAFAYLENLSTELAKLATTGDIVAKGNQWWTSESEFIFTPNSDFVNSDGTLVLDITGEALKAATDFYAKNIDASTPIIVNVSGTDVHFDSVNYHNELAQHYIGDLNYQGAQKNIPSNIIYNFYEAESVTMDGGGFYGHILAPKADFTILGGDLSGQVIAKSWTSSGGQFNLWNGLYPSQEESLPATAVPEPATALLLLLAFFILYRTKITQAIVTKTTKMPLAIAA